MKNLDKTLFYISLFYSMNGQCFDFFINDPGCSVSKMIRSIQSGFNETLNKKKWSFPVVAKSNYLPLNSSSFKKNEFNRTSVGKKSTGPILSLDLIEQVKIEIQTEFNPFVSSVFPQTIIDVEIENNKNQPKEGIHVTLKVDSLSQEGISEPQRFRKILKEPRHILEPVFDVGIKQTRILKEALETDLNEIQKIIQESCN